MNMIFWLYLLYGIHQEMSIAVQFFVILIVPGSAKFCCAFSCEEMSTDILQFAFRYIQVK